MQLKVFTLRLDPAGGEFDDDAMTAFLAERQVLSVSKHFFVHEQTPTWALLVSYRDGPDRRPVVAGRRTTGGSARPDPRVDLSAEETAVYDAVRRWRAARAQREGRPPYVLLTNRQIAAVVRQRPASLAQLREVEGIGAAKSQTFGEELLALLHAAFDAGDGQSPIPPAEPSGPSPSGGSAKEA